MPMKNLLQKIQPIQLYIILTLSVCFFTVQLFFSHITHALTLLVSAYHMLCNIIALSGCILTIKHGKQKQEKDTKISTKESQNKNVDINDLKLKNTFGWMRIDILTMSIVGIVYSSLSFSLLVEAIQTLVHIDHQHTMHLPIPIIIIGFIGLILNGICYILIGGYTMHQGSFLDITSDGDVILSRVNSEKSLKSDEKQHSKTKRDKGYYLNNQKYIIKRQGIMPTFRDLSSTIFVIFCGMIVYFANDQEKVAKLFDPLISICSCILLLVLSYPYLKQSCLILLQTIPDSIDIELFKKKLLLKFTEIISVHDLHIWQLTSSKYVSTVHIIFKNPEVYTNKIDDIKNFFYIQGITIVTIQPEFQISTNLSADTCLVHCTDIACIDKYCCPQIFSELQNIIVLNDKFLTNDKNENQLRTKLKRSKSELNVKNFLPEILLKKSKSEPVLFLEKNI